MDLGNAQMRAWRCRAFGDYHTLTLEHIACPAPGPGEVQVRVRAIAPGFPDMLMVQGLYQLKPPLPFTPCADFSGEVLALGAGVTTPAVGSRVMGVVRYGAAAEVLVVKATEALPLPSRFDYAAGAAYLIAFKTAYVALVVRGGLKPGDTLLVHGAAGGVGLAAVALGRHLGATVIATASTAEKRAVVAGNGAHHVLEANQPRLREAVKALTDGRGADVIYDPVGGDAFDESLHCIAPFGRLLVVGFAGGRIPQLPVNLVLIKQISIIGVRAGEYGRQYPEGGAAVNAALYSLAESGALTPHLHARHAFDELITVFDRIAAREVIGRVVIDLP